VEKTEKEPAKLHPWQRKSDETGIQYKAFQVYLKLGASRSLRKAAQKHKKGSGHYGRWASTHNWVERAKAYDLWVAAKTEPLRIKEVQKRAAEAESELTKELRAEYELLDLGKTLAQEMIQVGRAALRFPLHEETRTTTELDQGKPLPYRISHPGHPCTVWTSKSFNNFAWHLLLASALSEEFQRRWGKEHAVKPILGWMAKHPPPSSYAFDESFNLTPFAQAMPECFRGPDPVEAYRRLYHHKASLFDVTWKAPSTAPDWFSFGGVHSAKATFALSNRVDP
jgi:hypothetical protein